jgi:hypothetical protein
MNRDGMAAFLERLGHRVTIGHSTYWYDQRRHFGLAFPHAHPVDPPPDELRAIFRTSRAVGLRYVTSRESAGRLSYAFAVDDAAYDLAHLSANTRSTVRRGLKHCEVRRLDPGFARTHGRAANDETVSRLGWERDFYDWDRYWDAVAATPDVEVWGALRGREILSFVVAPIVDRCPEILVARSRTEALRLYPNNALIFAAVQAFIRRRDIDRVYFGIESLDQVSGVDQFKERMGFRRVPIRQRIVLSPTAERLLHLPLVRRAALSLARRWSDREFWRKVQGMLLFHDGPPEPREEHAWVS